MKKLYLFFLFSFVLFFIIPFVSSVNADALLAGEKQIQGYVKFEGWDTVKDYIIVQPQFSEWDSCYNNRNFYLINDGNTCNFGSETHCSSYYHPVAISRKYLSDIRLREENSDPNSAGSLYIIPCSSNGYKTAVVTDTIIPHEIQSISDKDPMVQKDYIVTFKGVNNNTHKLLMNVSDPIIETNQKDADTFKTSLTKKNTLSVPYANITDTTTPTRSMATPTNGNIPPSKPLYVVPIEQPKKTGNPANIIWQITSYISVALLFFIIGLLIGRHHKINTPDKPTPNDSTNTPV
jgi:hypothetical protein